jgi:hypothetical protein
MNLTPAILRQKAILIGFLWVGISLLETWVSFSTYPKGLNYGLSPAEARAGLIRFSPPEGWAVLPLAGTEGVLDSRTPPVIQVVVSHEFLNRPALQVIKWPLIYFWLTIFVCLFSYIWQWRLSRRPNP